MRATPALMRFSRSSDPIWTASRSKPPSELKKIGRSRFGRAAKKSRNRCAALSSNWPSPAIHSLQPRPQAFGSPVARIKIIGSFLTFASRRSISLGSSLAAMEIAGMQQSAATTNRVNSRVTINHHRFPARCTHPQPPRWPSPEIVMPSETCATVVATATAQ